MRALQKLMYVEDDPDIREVTQFALAVVGEFQLLLCATGDEAVHGGPSFGPDLVLLDVMMPGMDGPSTLARLRESPALAETPAIFITAKVQAREVAALRALGAIGVITKPFDPMLLANDIRAIWDGHFA